MRLIIAIVVLAALGAGGYWAYKTQVKGEKVEVPKIDVPKVDVNVEVDPWTKAEGFYHSYQYDKAVEAYRQVISQDKDPKHVEAAWFSIGSSYEKNKQPKDAIAAYEAAMKKYPKSEFLERAKNSLEKLKLMQGK